MVDLTNPETLAAVMSMQRKDIPELKALDEIMLAEMRRSCRLDIPLRTKQDFRKIAQILSDLSGRLALIASDHGLTTLQALRTAKGDVDSANRLMRMFCQDTKYSSNTQE